MISLNALVKGVSDNVTYKVDTTTLQRPRVRFYRTTGQEVGRVAMTRAEWGTLHTALGLSGASYGSGTYGG